MPKITVGIPVYKTTYLVQAISSVLTQTVGDFELLISDDSPDGDASKIVSRFQDPRIRLIEGPRRGLVANSVNIWDHASSDLLKFVYDDDYLFPTALEELSALLELSPKFTFAASRRVVVDEYGRELSRPVTYDADDWVWFEPAQLTNYLVRTVTNPIGEPSNMLIRRSAFEDSSCLQVLAGVPITYLIDVAFMVNASRRGPSVATAKYLSAFRQHPEQMSARSKDPRYAVGLLEWEVSLRAAVSVGLTPPEVALDGVAKLAALYRHYGQPFVEVRHFFSQLPALRELLAAGVRDVLTPQFRADLERAHRSVEARIAALDAGNACLPADAKPTDPGSTAGRVKAEVDTVTRRGARGWAWMPEQPQQIVHVEAVVGNRVVGDAVANRSRPDLKDWNVAGDRGFELTYYRPLLHDDAVRFRFILEPDWLPGQIKLPVLDIPPPQYDAEAPLREHARFTSPGPKFEEFASPLPSGVAKRRDGPDPLLIAFYLPQFHAIPENDRNWGAGFTEWTQLPKGIPRFPGHYQPRTPRDLGFYDLLDEEVIAKQCALALAAGVGAFGFYYYWFNNKRVLDKPTELFLASDIQMPFMIIWANDNWTRGWDGSEERILLKQDYDLEHEDALLADLARHMRDPRYVRIEGRPLFVLYNPKPIPDAAATLARWRRKWSDVHGLEPLIFMAQTFYEEDPQPYGLDGALEFPPHKFSLRAPETEMLTAFSADFQGQVIPYDTFARLSLAEPPPPFPLIKTIVPSWDNEPRRPNRGLVLEGSTPQKYQGWLQTLVERAMDRPIGGLPIVCINAWNEWAEGAYLEPDVHFGSAYLNATARAVDAAIRKRCPAEPPGPESPDES